MASYVISNPLVALGTTKKGNESFNRKRKIRHYMLYQKSPPTLVLVASITSSNPLWSDNKIQVIAQLQLVS